ncbi:hypothetical protein AHAS_Ahas15G0323700 [Arachis hypogaea]
MELGTSSNQNVPRDVAQPIIGHPSNHCSAAQHKGTEDVFISDKFKPKEITAIMNDFAEPGSLAFTALYLGGTKYMVIQSEPGAVIREKKSSGLILLPLHFSCSSLVLLLLALITCYSSLVIVNSGKM